MSLIRTDYVPEWCTSAHAQSVLATGQKHHTFQTSDRLVFRRSSFLCHHWPLLLVFLKAARLLEGNVYSFEKNHIDYSVYV